MPSSDPSELQPRELLQIFAEFFEQHAIDYRVVGSMASIAYGENRFTNDVDMVCDLRLEHVELICNVFSHPTIFSLGTPLKTPFENASVQYHPHPCRP